MKNITFDSASFSERLGLYDFFNVLICGAVFIFGICAIHFGINEYLWENIGFNEGVGLVLLIYIIGMLLQKLRSVVAEKSTTNNMVKV